MDIQKLASERRQGTIDEHEAKRRLRQIDDSWNLVVYDGSRLEQAIIVLLKKIG